MGVGISGEGDGGVTQELLNGFEVGSGSQGEGGSAVAKIP